MALNVWVNPSLAGEAQLCASRSLGCTDRAQHWGELANAQCAYYPWQSTTTTARVLLALQLSIAVEVWSGQTQRDRHKGETLDSLRGGCLDGVLGRAAACLLCISRCRCKPGMSPRCSAARPSCVLRPGGVRRPCRSTCTPAPPMTGSRTARSTTGASWTRCGTPSTRARSCSRSSWRTTQSVRIVFRAVKQRCSAELAACCRQDRTALRSAGVRLRPCRCV